MADKATKLKEALHAYHQASDALVKNSNTMDPMEIARNLIPWVRACADLAVAGIDVLSDAGADYLAAQQEASARAEADRQADRAAAAAARAASEANARTMTRLTIAIAASTFAYTLV